jgi:putative endopeptidase
MFKYNKPLVLLIISAALLSFLLPEKTYRKFIDPANMDLSIRPVDNFYLYADGNWIKNNPVPPSKTRWGSFNELNDNNTDRLHKLLEQAAQSKSTPLKFQKVGDFYISGMDSVMLDKLGYDPIKKDLLRINNLSSTKDILEEMAFERTHGIAFPLLSVYVAQDRKQADKYIPQIGQGGLTLPDRDYYLKNDGRSRKVRDKYVSYMQNLFQMTGSSESESRTKSAAVLNIETTLAGAELSRTEMRDVNKTYNKFSWNGLSAITPDIDWKELLSKLMIHNTDSVVVQNPGFEKTIDSMLHNESLSDWKAYMQWHVISAAAPDLSEPFVSENFKFNQVLTGQKEMTPRWERVSRQIDGSLGDLLGELFVEKYFNAASKKRMLELVNNLQQTFGERIKRLDWMSEATKQKALYKLAAIAKKIGYTDKWRDYSSVVIKKDDFLGNKRRSAIWAYQDMIGRLGKPVDKTRWSMTPPTVNAYYSPSNNDINFPAGILQFPFFDFEADDAVNYGAIGCVIGHEMTHGFDDQGRQYDAKGNLIDWWTKEDAEKFKAKADALAHEYDEFKIQDSLHVNGRLTLGENLADLGGISIAYEAFSKTQQFKEGKKIDGFTPARRFFLSYAQMWRTNVLPEEEAQRLLIDPHSPSQARVNVPLENIDAWYSAFDVKPGEKMYKPPNERIRIW